MASESLQIAAVIKTKSANTVLFWLTLLSPNSDGNEISLYIITTCLNVQVMRIKKVITKGKTS